MAFCRRHKARQDPHRGRLARAIGTEKCQHLSLGDRKGDTINCRMMAVSLGNVVNVDHESDIGANNCGVWSGLALKTTTSAATTGILLTTSEAVNTAMWIKSD